MKRICRSTIGVVIVMAALAVLSGCSDRKPDIDYTLIGGTYQAEDNEYNVQIFKSSSDVTEEAPAESKESTSDPVDTTAKPATTQKTAVTVTTDKPAITIPAQTVRTDLPKVTAEPQYTTASTTTTKPKNQTEPTEVESDENGFPVNPNDGDKFTDSTGQSYQYDGSLFFRWIPYNNDGKTIVQEFPDNYGEIGSGKQVLQ